MDAFEILGIRANPKSQKDLLRLHRHAGKLQAHYAKRSRREDVKRVKWAFDTIKKQTGLELPEPDPKPASPDAAGEASAGGASPSSPGPEAKADGGVKRKASSQLSDAERRREAIKEKLLLRRQASDASMDEKSKRQDTIKERLAAKRVIKKVRVRSEEDFRKNWTAAAAAASAAAVDGGEASRAQRFPLICPLPLERIKTACRGAKCDHLQCFDLETFLMNKATECPICEAPLTAPDDLVSEAFLTLACTSVADESINEIQFDAAGEWTVVAGGGASPDSSDDEMPVAEPFGASPSPEMDEDDAYAVADAAREAAEEQARVDAQRKAEEAERKTEELKLLLEKREAQKAEQERLAAESAAKAEEERKMKALLRFIPNKGPHRSKA